MNLLEFYPTPKSLIDKMISGVDFKLIDTVLEPSAGAGHLCEAVNKKMKYARNIYADDKDEYRGDIDCVEIDNDLRGILKNKNYRVIHNDFLMYNTKKKYSLIIMNPPFSDGDKHLLKAIELQETYGGMIICILNAETLWKPFSNYRKTLVRRLEELEADIEYLSAEFESAERRTDVEVALIKIIVPDKRGSLILDCLDKAKEREHTNNIDPTEVTSGNFIDAIIERYNYEINAGINLIREYDKIRPYVAKNIKGESERYVDSSPILELKIYDSDNYGRDKNIINGYIKKVRVKYWRALFENREFIQNLTSNLQRELYSRVSELAEYEFSYHNIMEMRIELNRKTIKGVEDTILNLFDDLSQKHSYSDEYGKNIHYFNGWKTNKAYKINKKVIIPMYGALDIWNNKFKIKYTARDKLTDIEKSLAFLDGGETPEISLTAVLDAAERNQISQNIELKYFKITLYKKGTCHLTFTNDRLLDKFNIFGCQRKGWLPPCYAKKKYNDMTNEEKAAVDDFGVNYTKVMTDTKYYIVELDKFLLASPEPVSAADENSVQSGDYEANAIPADTEERESEQPVSEETAELTEENNETDTQSEILGIQFLYADYSEMYEQLTIA